MNHPSTEGVTGALAQQTNWKINTQVSGNSWGQTQCWPLAPAFVCQSKCGGTTAALFSGEGTTFVTVSLEEVFSRDMYEKYLNRASHESRKIKHSIECTRVPTYISFRLRGRTTLLIWNSTQCFACKPPKPEGRQEKEEAEERNFWSWALLELSTWVVLGGGYFCMKYTCVFVELEVNFSEITDFYLTKSEHLFHFWYE